MHEVEFVEQFERQHRLTWIPRDQPTPTQRAAGVKAKPTNDFVWHSNNNIEADVKRTKAKYSSIRDLIVPKVKAARIAGVVKENYIADIGNAPLTDKLRGQLGKFNTRNPDNQIARLYVWSQGTLHRIQLEK